MLALTATMPFCPALLRISAPSNPLPGNLAYPETQVPAKRHEVGEPCYEISGRHSWRDSGGCQLLTFTIIATPVLPKLVGQLVDDVLIVSVEFPLAVAIGK